MRKYIAIVFVLFCVVNFSSYSQTSLTVNEIPGFQHIPQEQIFVHHNTSFLLTGESLYYRVYCLDIKTKKLSDISKIAYVELIGSDNVSVLKHKIILNSGLGEGDFFVPTTVNSGNYKIIAYTQWMRNVEGNNFFQDDISIINPFQSNQDAILSTQDNEKSINTFNDKASFTAPDNPNKNNELVSVQLTDKIYGNREKIAVKIKALQKEASFGNYSISVRKIDTLQIPEKKTSISSFQNKNVISSLKDKNTIFLPELRGELIQGKVILKDNLTPAANVKVGISISGKEYLFKVANTNNSGLFYVTLDKEYENQSAIFQVIGENRANYSIEITTDNPLKYNNLQFFQFKISSQEKDYILKHSIYNQIENTYSILKPNTQNSLKPIKPFFNSKEKTYYLDDYTRFPTIKETIVEVIPEVFVMQKKGMNKLHVKLYDEDLESDLSSLVLVDGNLIQDQNDLIAYNANKVKSIQVVSEQYLYGSEIFQGIVSIETFDGDFSLIPSGDFIKNISLFKPLVQKNYFNQTYEDNHHYKRIPDFRNQLLWQPRIILDTNEYNIVFYSSDNNGDYEICLEGVTINGKPVSVRKIISVR